MSNKSYYYCGSCTKGKLTRCKECGEILEPYLDENSKKWKPKMSHRHTERNSKGENTYVKYPCVLLKIFHQHRSQIGRKHFTLPTNFYPDDFKKRKMWVM